MSGATWGEEETRFFHSLSPDRVLEAVEAAGIRSTGRCLALNSFENRVYEVELELDSAPSTPAERFRIAKFYRPGRWNEAQILEEHEFLRDLEEEEIPVVAPLRFADGSTLQRTPEGIFYAVFPKIGGRAPDELSDDQLRQVGRLLARIHQVGGRKTARHRVQLTAQSYGIANLEYLLREKWIPAESSAAYEDVVRRICERIEPLLREFDVQRVHGDCHLGNLLWGSKGLFFVDFDDFVMAPPVQDLWLLLASRNRERMEVLLDGYEQIRHLDRSSFILIEPLRALRIIHYTGWVARRWADPAFPRAFPHFGSPAYWKNEIRELEQEWQRISAGQTFD